MLLKAWSDEPTDSPTLPLRPKAGLAELTTKVIEASQLHHVTVSETSNRVPIHALTAGATV